MARGKSHFSSIPKPKQGNHDAVPSGLGYETHFGGSEDVDLQAPIARKAGLPEIGFEGTFSMLNSKKDESDPY